MNNVNAERDIYSKEYIVKNENIFYNVKIEKYKNDIIIKIEDYNIKINNKNLSTYILSNYKINDTDKLYKFLTNLFNKNKVYIKNINDINIILVFIYENKKEFELILKKEHNIIIDIDLLSSISKENFAPSTLDNTFTVFKSINNLFYLIFYSFNNSIICYNLERFQIISKIKSKTISNFRHFLDKINKRDLILTISYSQNELKVWNVINLECILHIKDINKDGYLYSSCIFCENSQNFIITSNYIFSTNSEVEALKIFDFNGNKIGEINNSDENTYFVDVYYDNTKFKNYIIVGNGGYIKSYDYNKNKIYHKYYDNSNKAHISLIIKDNDEIVKLIESCNDGNIRIWDFHNCLLLSKIKIEDECLNGICLWKERFLFIGCEEGTFKVIDLEKKRIIKNIINDSEEVLTIKIIFLPNYGNCLISQSLGKEEIKIWKINC